MALKGVGAAAVAAAAVLASSACGSGTPTPTSAPDGQDRLVAYARCMRSHGIPVGDPDPAHPGRLTIPKSAQRDQDRLAAAERACRKYGGKLQAGPDDPAQQDRAVRLARCLRRHGVDVADPQPGQSLTLPQRMSSPQVQRALQACRNTGTTGTAAPGGRG